MSIRILLADDHQVMRQGLRNLLEKETDFTVVAEAENGREAVRMARELNPHVVLMDVSMPDLNGVEATRQITAEAPQVRVVALSMHLDKRFVSGMMKAGARGYVLKNCAFEEIARAVRDVADNRSYLCSRVADVVRDDYVRKMTQEEEPSAFSVLSSREREVLQLVAEGLSTKEIASRLGLSAKTIETHRSQVMKKLDLHTVADLTKYAIREGLTSLEE
jgi:RNA polymerase sigma factor (sigma-70 family)